MSFASPWLLLFLLPFLFAAWRLLRERRRTGLKFSAVGRLPVRTSGWRAYAAALAPFLLVAALAFLTLAVTRPRTPRDADGAESRRQEARSVETVDIMIVMDVSGSMEVLDLASEDARAKIVRWLQNGHALTDAEAEMLARENRLSVVKRLFAEFVNRRPDDFIGLVTFGTFAEVIVPLTRNHKLLLSALKDVEIPEDSNTAIGDGLGLAIARLEDSSSKSKVIVLLSDGQQTIRGAALPEEAAALAARKGIKVYTIGIGTSARVPFVGESAWRPGRKFITLTDNVFDEAQLMDIARVTGGRYFSVREKQAALAEALEEIDRLEKTKIEEDPLSRTSWQMWNDHYRPLLFLGVGLLLLGLVLNLLAARRLA